MLKLTKGKIDRLMLRNSRARPLNVWWELPTADWVREYQNRSSGTYYVAWLNCHSGEFHVYERKQTYNA